MHLPVKYKIKLILTAIADIMPAIKTFLIFTKDTTQMRASRHYRIL
jgi:hypothetical protein